jgi:glycerate kinase
VRLLAAPDKLRGSLDARAAARAIAAGATACGWEAVELPLSDGGEGFAQVLGGVRRRVLVHGPLGDSVEASYAELDDDVAVVEMAQAAGRSLLARPHGDDPLGATTQGVGELVAAAIAGGARKVIVGCGGSATTDGGRAAVDAIEAAGGLCGVELLVATDVRTRFVDAAADFGPQKGASPEQVDRLRARLERDARHYLDRYGIDVRGLERSGAAGGLAGGLAALGGCLVSGFDVVSEHLGLEEEIAAADLVATAEGRLDASTLEGKTVAALLALLDEATPALVLCGQLDHSVVEFLQAGCASRVEVVQIAPSSTAKETAAALRAAVIEVLRC